MSMVDDEWSERQLGEYGGEKYDRRRAGLRAKRKEGAPEGRLVPVNEESGVETPPSARRNFSLPSDRQFTLY